MPEIVFLPSGKACSAASGTSLQEAAERAGVNIAFPCAGKGACGKCLVKIERGAVDFDDNGKLSWELLNEGFVLACRSRVGSGDAEILIPFSLSEEQGKFSDALARTGIDERLYPSAEDISPLAVCEKITVAAAEPLDGLGDFDRFSQAAKKRLGVESVDVPLEVLQRLPDALRQNGGQIYVWHTTGNNRAYIADIAAERPETEYGLAVDIGTTTVAVALVDCARAKIADTVTRYNEQLERGADVISRISYAKNPERVKELQSRVVSTINLSIGELCGRNGHIPHECIRNVTVAANTTMTQLFMGVNPQYIRLEPYTPAVMGVPCYSAGALGLSACPSALVWIAPNVGSYVGGDITAGLLCTDFAAGTDELCLFIDVGTNGEIVLGNDDFLLSCACSAGPAFEGGGIEMGMRASAGAIERVEIDPETHKAAYAVIGGGKPLGICGSGLISLVAELYRRGVIDQRGEMDRTGKFPQVAVNGKNARYYVVPPEEGNTGVYISENDIDNFIRAKAAIFSACVTMLNSVELDFDSVTKFYIAGGFGRYINIEKSQVLGLLPLLSEESFCHVGNSSLTGAFMALTSKKHRDKIEALASRITYIDLSTEPKYMDEYVAAMFIPHTDQKLFPA